MLNLSYYYYPLRSIDLPSSSQDNDQDVIRNANEGKELNTKQGDSSSISVFNTRRVEEEEEVDQIIAPSETSSPDRIIYIETTGGGEEKSFFRDENQITLPRTSFLCLSLVAQVEKPAL